MTLSHPHSTVIIFAIFLISLVLLFTKWLIDLLLFAYVCVTTVNRNLMLLIDAYNYVSTFILEINMWLPTKIV